MNTLYVSVQFILHSNFHTDELVQILAQQFVPDYEIICKIDGQKFFHNGILLTKPFITGIHINVNNQPVTMFVSPENLAIQEKLSPFFDALMQLPESS